MRNFIVICCLVLLAGCGPGRGTAHQLGDSDKTCNAFLAVVPAYYATRSDGVLSEPLMKDRRISFTYRYRHVVSGNHTEQVTLLISYPPRSAPDAVLRRGPTWSVGAWHLRDGSDPVIPAVQAEIESRMLAALAAKE